MEYQTIEGTWEEILEYSGELAGQRVKLTVLPPQTSSDSNQETLAQKLRGRVGKVNFQPSDLSERVKETFTEILAQKNHN